MRAAGARDGSTRRLRGRKQPRVTRAELLEAWCVRRDDARTLYGKLKSYRAVGDRLGVSRQRAWQLVNQPTKGSSRG